MRKSNGCGMNRVVIIGCPGSGKSTLARKLRDRTDLPLVSLDNLWWKPDRTHVAREEFDAALAAILETDAWIIEGNYSRTYEPRIKACDTVILLDYDTDLCLQSIEQRVGQVRPDIPWTETELDPELVDLVLHFKARNDPVLSDLFRRYADRTIRIFHDRDEADAWLQSV